MAYYAALVSLVQLLKEITRPDPPYAKSLLDKQQIHVFFYEKFNLLQELLEDYSSKDHQDKSTDILESRIREAAYHAQDIIESHISESELMTNKESHTIHKEDLQKKYYQELQKVKAEVESIVEEMMRIKMESLTTNEHNLHVIRHSASTQGPSIQAAKVQAPSSRNNIAVFDEHLMTTIKGQLCGESSRLEVISIVGMGGLGKTTLGRNIFDAKLIEDRFDCRSWVTVSQDYHLRNILLAIVDSFNMKKVELREAEENVLVEHIYKHLFGRRYLIILDDMWDTKVWNDIKKIFPDNSDGSRIMITTRLSDVAVYAGCNSKFLHQMPFLNEEQGWSLLRQKVFAQEHCPGELEVIGKLIAENCRGIPLAIVVIAGVLSSVNKARHDWKTIARKVSSTAIDQNDEHLSKILSLSYNHLPHHLKPCFLYLVGFPEDHEISIPKLISFWVAEGFLKPIESKSLEEVGKEYLEDLVNRNLVFLTKKKFHGKFKYCSIHDLLRELCLQRAHSDKFFLCLHQKDDFHRNPIGNVRRVYIETWDEPLFLNCIAEHVSQLRSVISFSSHHNLLVESDCKLLRILCARNLFPQQNNFDEVNEIVKLLHLRHLEFDAFYFHFPPSIFKLQNLQTLIVHRGHLSLPVEIWKLPQLRHVIGGLVRLPPIPYDEIRIMDGVPLLGRLQTLSKVGQFIFTSDTVEMIPSLKKLKVRCTHVKGNNVWEELGLNNLVHLRQLQSLLIQIHGVKSNVASLPENFTFPLNLMKLTLMNCELPWKEMRVVGSLPNLQILKLRLNAFVGEEWEPVEGEFLKLKFLLMDSLYYLKYWRAENTHFPCLEQLHFRECGELEEIPSEIGDIPTLQLIEVVECNSGLESSALEIQREQRDHGNDDLQVCVVPETNDSWKSSADEDESNAEEDESSADEDESNEEEGESNAEEDESSEEEDESSAEEDESNAEEDE